MGARKTGLTVRLLGYPEFRWAGNPLKLPTQKSLAILCYLAVRKQAATREELAELLWLPGAGANLRPELHRLRTLPGADEWLEVADTVTVIADTDLASFELAVQEERFQEALLLHPSSELLLRGLEPKDAPAFEDWLDVERWRVSTLLRDALRGQSLALEQEGALADALTLVRQLIELDPLDESAYRAAMRCEYKRSHVQAALSYFETCRRVLKEELGVEPLAETLELAREIERGSTLPDLQDAPSRQRIPKQLLRPPALVGREREWTQLEAAWEAGQSMNLSGPPGIGKTRLMMDFASAKGSFFLLEGRPGDKVVPYSSLARALREALKAYPDLKVQAEPWVEVELARILPDVFELRHESGSDVSEARFFEALVHLMGRLRQEVKAIMVDDLQYLDAKSFEVGIGAQARLMTEGMNPDYARLMAAFRVDELPEAFAQGLALAVDYGLAVHIELEPLDEAAVETMLTSLDTKHTDALTPQLQRLTGGNPQFIVETLKGLYASGNLQGTERLELPDKVVSFIRRRLDGLSKLALRLIQAMAVLKQATEPEVLAKVLEMSPFDVVETLAELEAAQVLHDGAFVHDLLYETVLAMTPTLTQNLLHRRIAEVLEQLGADPARVAHHWQEVGELERAAANWLNAAHQFQEAGLYSSALELLQQAIAHAPEPSMRHEARLRLASVYLDTTRVEAARKAALPLLEETLSPDMEARLQEFMAQIRLGEKKVG